MAKAELCSAAQCVGRVFEAAGCSRRSCCFPAGRKEEVSLWEGMLLTATRSQELMWGSIKTDRELNSLPSDELKIIFKIILSFLWWQWKSHVPLAALRSSQVSQALGWGLDPWGGMGAVPIALCSAGTQANCRAGSRTLPRQWEQSSLESPALWWHSCGGCIDTALRAPSIFQLSSSHQAFQHTLGSAEERLAQS